MKTLTITLTTGKTRNYTVVSVETVGPKTKEHGVTDMMIVEGANGALYIFTEYANGYAGLANLKGDGPEVMEWAISA